MVLTLHLDKTLYVCVSMRNRDGRHTLNEFKYSSETLMLWVMMVIYVSGVGTIGWRVVNCSYCPGQINNYLTKRCCTYCLLLIILILKFYQMLMLVCLWLCLWLYQSKVWFSSAHQACILFIYIQILLKLSTKHVCFISQMLNLIFYFNKNLVFHFSVVF